MNINVSLVRQLVAAQFPQWADLPIKPVEFDGSDNTTFHLGKNMSVRLPRTEAYSLQVEKEHRWLPKLASFLPLPIPAPLAKGVPAEDYPWHWSIYQWLEGENLTIKHIADLNQLATTLAQFLISLQRIDPTDGPAPGLHNFYRGGSLTVYDSETREAVAALDSEIDTVAATTVWETAIQATWQGPPVWVHGDVATGNLLVDTKGQLSAVIDFGCSAVGDSACDLVIAWTLFSGESRETFHRALPVDGATWARGRGWALWKALITLAGCINTDPLKARNARQVIDEVLADHKRTTGDV